MSLFSVRETQTEAQQEKNAKLREAFGISEYFVEGSSLDPSRHAKEAEARAAATKVYDLSPAENSVSDKKSKKRSASNTKKKKSKKHKRDRWELLPGRAVDEGSTPPGMTFQLFKHELERGGT